MQVQLLQTHYKAKNRPSVAIAKQSTVSHGPPLIVELFAGRAALLSRALIQADFEVVSIDHNVDSRLAAMVSFDLTTSSGQPILWQILAMDWLFALHMGLPCGTSSRAREKPIRTCLQRQGVPSPIPLRVLETLATR